MHQKLALSNKSTVFQQKKKYPDEDLRPKQSYSILMNYREIIVYVVIDSDRFQLFQVQQKQANMPAEIYQIIMNNENGQTCILRNNKNSHAVHQNLRYFRTKKINSFKIKYI